MRSLKYKLTLLVVAIVGIVTVGLTPAVASAACKTELVRSNQCCGQASMGVETAIKIGCRGQGNPITDMLFAVIRLLSNGVGIVIVISLIIGGIQYTTSAGDPQASAKAMSRVRATVMALALYIFAYPLLNYLIPSGFFK